MLKNFWISTSNWYFFSDSIFLEKRAQILFLSLAFCSSVVSCKTESEEKVDSAVKLENVSKAEPLEEATQGDGKLDKQPTITTSKEVVSPLVEEEKKEFKVPVGKLGVYVQEREDDDPQGLVRITLGNRLGEAIETARIWVFLMDDTGKMVNQKAQWVIGSDIKGGELANDEMREFKVFLPTNEPYTKTKVSFSKIVLKNEKSVHPESVMVGFRPEE